MVTDIEKSIDEKIRKIECGLDAASGNMKEASEMMRGFTMELNRAHRWAVPGVVLGVSVFVAFLLFEGFKPW